MAREDLNPIEEARACALLVEELGLTREDVGRRVGRSRVAVSNLLRLLDLPDEVLELLAEGELTEGHGRALLMASDHADRRRLARAAAVEGWTVRAHRGRGPRGRTPTTRAGRAPRAGRAACTRPGRGGRAPRRRARPGARRRGPGAPAGRGLPRDAGVRLARRGDGRRRAPRRRRTRLTRLPQRAPDSPSGARYHRAAGAISSVG